MAERKDWLSKVESRWALAKELGAIPVIGGSLGLGFAAFTDFMSQWAPFSWFVGALIGALAMQGWSLLRSWQGEREENRRRIALLEAPKGQINPRQDLFQNQRVHISDLMPPVGMVIANKEFRDCDLVGPAVIYTHTSEHGSTELYDIVFLASDGVVANPRFTIQNAAVFQDCSFRRCKFYQVTIVMPYGIYMRFHDSISGLNWINDELVPKSPAEGSEPQSSPSTEPEAQP